MDGIVEWKIENLSRWCEAVHGRSIPGPYISNLGVEIFPKGTDGQHDRMEVHFIGVIGYLPVDVSFFYSDRSLLCPSQQVPYSFFGPGVVLGPKFEEVVGKIREADHEDNITVRFNFHKNSECYERHMSTVLQVMNLSFDLDPKLIRTSTSGNSVTIYSFSKNGGDRMVVTAINRGDRIHLLMKPPTKMKHPISVESNLNRLRGDLTLVNKETGRHVFEDEEEWLLSDSHKIKDLEEDGVTLRLRLKVINGDIFHKYGFELDRIIKKTPEGSTFCTPDVKRMDTPSSSNKCDDSVTVLTNELMCLYQDQDYSDLTLKCGDVTFPVHRNILNARSPVFKSMLSSDMREASSGQVDIGDLHPSTLARFLAFLYTGQVEEGLDGEGALNLYYAADKYQVPSLKKECVDFFCSNVSISNVCDILSLADKHQDERLSSAAHDFIVQNFNEVLSSEEWNRLVNSNSLLVAKTLTNLAKKK